ncbi:hypothetical protein BRADI_1g25887v3 [Brachypodium distachyon]|uniref:Uncharacterized protein n=1 Tax=Brachypodium distachyon TaxID=15368 RepID=A0A2K2DL31_BRADI|nr:hypothetical protein BRADI_1g25887v3 [Brachypodium distachyon]
MRSRPRHLREQILDPVPQLLGERTLQEKDRCVGKQCTRPTAAAGARAGGASRGSGGEGSGARRASRDARRGGRRDMTAGRVRRASSSVGLGHLRRLGAPASVAATGRSAASAGLGCRGGAGCAQRAAARWLELWHRGIALARCG